MKIFHLHVICMRSFANSGNESFVQVTLGTGMPCTAHFIAIEAPGVYVFLASSVRTACASTIGITYKYYYRKSASKRFKNNMQHNPIQLNGIQWQIFLIPPKYTGYAHAFIDTYRMVDGAVVRHKLVVAAVVDVVVDMDMRVVL